VVVAAEAQKTLHIQLDLEHLDKVMLEVMAVEARVAVVVEQAQLAQLLLAVVMAALEQHALLLGHQHFMVAVVDHLVILLLVALVALVEEVMAVQALVDLELLHRELQILVAVVEELIYLELEQHLVDLV
jgi:hypothetical protein